MEFEISMDAMQACVIVEGVMEILDDLEGVEGHEKIQTCRAALHEVARWLEMVAEVDEVPYERGALGV